MDLACFGVRIVGDLLGLIISWDSGSTILINSLILSEVIFWSSWIAKSVRLKFTNFWFESLFSAGNPDSLYCWAQIFSVNAIVLRLLWGCFLRISSNLSFLLSVSSTLTFFIKDAQYSSKVFKALFALFWSISEFCPLQFIRYIGPVANQIQTIP